LWANPDTLMRRALTLIEVLVVVAIVAVVARKNDQ